MGAPGTPTRENEGGKHGDKSRLLRHVVATYNTLWFGMAVIAFAFPLLLWGWGRWYDLPLQGSMSVYYCVGPNMGIVRA